MLQHKQYSATNRKLHKYAMFTTDWIPMPLCGCCDAMKIPWISTVHNYILSRMLVLHQFNISKCSFGMVEKSFLWPPRFIENVQCMRSVHCCSFGCWKWIFWREQFAMCSAYHDMSMYIVLLTKHRIKAHYIYMTFHCVAITIMEIVCK